MVQGIFKNDEVKLAGLKGFRLKEFFDPWWDDYKKHPKEYIYPEQYKAVSAMRTCRTDKLGIDYYACDKCGDLSAVYHSCKNRFCPTCSWKDTLEWAKRIENEILDIPHRHVVFTLPHSLNNLIKSNKQELLSLLFVTASDTIKDWMYHKYKLIPGIICVLHTFGEKKDFHPHIHMIVSWGGLDSRQIIETIKGEYVKYDFIQTKFRCKFEDKLIEYFDANKLEHNFSHRQAFMRFIKGINQHQWRIQLEPAMQIPSEVIRYVGRYSKRACISEHKITNIEGENITFKYKDYKNTDYNGKPIVKEMSMHYTEFFPRLLQHVPLPYFRIVRYYGIYAARAKGVLKKLYSGIKFQTEPSEEEVYELAENPKLCIHCNQNKKYIYSVFKDRNGIQIFMTRYSLKKNEERHKKQVA